MKRKFQHCLPALFVLLSGIVQGQTGTPYAGYLFTYFEGTGDRNKQEQIRFALSGDAVHWTALNNNAPVLSADTISVSGGVRDPHILRGQDGRQFYMVATDMLTAKNGWDSNPGIVLYRSDDLLHWKHKAIDLAKVYPERFGNVKWVWAPQTIYDPQAGKYLIYFTVRFHGDDKLDFYAGYANAGFTGFEKEPTLFFRAQYGAIDGDIIFKDNQYHFFFKGNTKDSTGKEIRNGIKQATAASLQGPWLEDTTYLDAYAHKGISVEGSGVFRLNGKEEYILMYDLYRNHRYEFQRSTDLFHFSQVPESFTKDFNPRHGTVISLTKEEMERLKVKWGMGLLN